jgi:hypothetical protein
MAILILILKYEFDVRFIFALAIINIDDFKFTAVLCGRFIKEKILCNTSYVNYGAWDIERIFKRKNY